jgi:hypothetical protein
MKQILKISLAIALTLCALIAPIRATAASLVLATSGVTMSFPDNILRPVPETGTTVSFDFANNSASSVVEIKFEIVDKTGAVIYAQNTPESLLKFGSKARVNSNFYDAQFKKAVEPLTISLFVAYLDAGAGKTTRRIAQVGSPFKFIERPIAVPTPTVTVTFTPAPMPTPTVTVTSSALVSENSLLRSQLNKLKLELKSLTSKMSKICKAKPKPKGC